MDIIAEVKTKSPFGFVSLYAEQVLFNVADQIGNIISIHTNRRWGGSMDLITKYHTQTNKPILAKGIHGTDQEVEQALRYGASYVLVVGRIPDKSLWPWIMYEPLNLAQLKDTPPELKVVWNSRNLTDGSLKIESFAEARALFPGWLCQASNIKYPNDILPGAEAIIIGQNLVHYYKMINGSNCDQ